MTREEITKEALMLIEKVAGYSPKTGEVLKREFSKMVVMGCQTSLEEKTPVLEFSKNVMDAEADKARENVSCILRLSELVTQAGTLKCGGS